MTGLGSFPFARHYSGNHYYFLFLCLLRCFSSAGSLICAMSSTWRVSPFGNLRIKSYLPIPEAYRSLSRPSSPPRAKASPVYSFLLSSTHAPFAPHGVLLISRQVGSLYCCLLFFFNFFQYVKELFDPGQKMPTIIVPFITGTGEGGE